MRRTSRDDAAMPAPQARMCPWLRAAASMIRSCAISKNMLEELGLCERFYYRVV